MNKFKDLFCTEAEDQLLVLSQTLLALEERPGDTELYEKLMRSAHTIKGAAATMGYTEMAKLAHALEDLFRAAELKTIDLDPAAISVALASLDQMSASLASIKENGNELAVDSRTQELTALLSNAQIVKSAAGSKEAAPSVQQPASREPAFAAPTSIRVSVERLDTLMGLFEEMLMLRLKLDTILEPATTIIQTVSDPIIKQKIYFLAEFQNLFTELARLLSEIQGELLTVRLVPLDQIFSQFPRMVRDLAIREGKQISFHMEGESVELDRTVLDGLGGALAHLLRNAVDHGISEKGTIQLRAERWNDRVHVIVEDSGTGIDYEKVRQIAIERGIVGKEEGEKLRKVEIAELLFQQNMSTSPTVTDISGRGVGLSAVRAFAADVGGRVTITSPITPSGGTRFLVDLPVSIATMKVLVVSSSGFTFAIPFTSIVRTVRFDAHMIVKSATQEALIIGTKPVPVLRLNHLLKITFADIFQKGTESSKELVAVLVNIDDEQVLILVDECVGERELLVKSLPTVLRDIRGFSGSALLPDGRTILLLDVHGLLLQAFGDILETTKVTPAENPII